MKALPLKLFVVALLFSSDTLHAQSSNFETLLQAKIDSVCKTAGIPAMAFTCQLPGGEIVTVAYGMNKTDRMLAGSTGKTFFASLALRYIKEGKLSLEEKVSAYLGKESWYGRLPNHETITVRMLFEHTTGIEEYYPLGDFTQRLRANPNKTWTPEELIGYVLDRPALFVAGTDWSYADTNYIVLAMIMEKISGKKAYDEIDTYFLIPNKLQNTEPSISRKLRNLVAGITTPKNPFGIQSNMIENDSLVINPQMEWAGGGYISNTIDLARWAKIFYEGYSLPQALLDDQRKGVPAKTGKDHRYSFAMQIRPSALGTSYGHGGWFPGYLTEMDYFPERKFSVAIQIATDDFQKLKRGPRFFEMFFAATVAKVLAVEKK